MDLLTVDNAFSELSELLEPKAPCTDTDSAVDCADRPDISGLTRRRIHRSWRELAADGFNVPTVSVISLLTRTPLETVEAKLQRLSPTVKACGYPGVTAIAAIRSADAAFLSPKGVQNGIHLVPVEENEYDLAVALKNCSADFVRIWDDEPLHDLTDHISMIYRSSLVMGAWGRHIADLPMVADRIPHELSAGTVHRRALDLLVVRKLPLSSALQRVPLFTDKASERVDLLKVTPLGF
jgi:hypothetical protein